MKKVLRLISYVYLVGWAAVIVYWKLLFSPLDGPSETSQILLSPSLEHLFGTDALGRDLLARILEGGYITMSVGVFSSLLSLTLACLFGVVWTWFRPKSGFVLLVMDILQAIPSYVISSLVFLLIQRFFSTPMGTIFSLAIALALTHWMNPARILRAQTLQLKTSPFIEAARALGGSSWHILRIHVSGHLYSTLLVLWALQVPILLMYESFMSFIGFGVEAPFTSWGLLLQEGWRYLSDYPHLLLGPGAVLFTILLALNYVLDYYRIRRVPMGRARARR